MPHQTQDYQNAKRILDVLISLNKAIVAAQYRILYLKKYNQKDPKDINFFYLN